MRNILKGKSISINKESLIPVKKIKTEVDVKKGFSEAKSNKKYNERIDRHSRFVFYGSEKFISNQLNYLLNVKIVSNNIFLTLSKNFKVICKVNSSIINQKISKKNKKYFLSDIVNAFKNKVLPLVKGVKGQTVALYIFLKIPRAFKRLIIELLTTAFYGYDLILVVHSLKVFNGCRAKKAIRKKKRRYRVYK